eukprot:UN10181
MVDDETSFYVHCMVDDTMYLSPEQLSVYEDHKDAAGTIFELILSQDYESESDIDIEHLPKLCDLKAYVSDDEDLNEEYGQGKYDKFEEQDETSENLLWAFVIFVQALYFGLGIYAYIFWWGFCKRSTWGAHKENKSMNENVRFGCHCCKR